jgi:hypothetical protein
MEYDEFLLLIILIVKKHKFSKKKFNENKK